MEAGKEAIDVFEQTNDEDDEEELDGIKKKEEYTLPFFYGEKVNMIINVPIRILGRFFMKGIQSFEYNVLL